MQIVCGSSFLSRVKKRNEWKNKSTKQSATYSKCKQSTDLHAWLSINSLFFWFSKNNIVIKAKKKQFFLNQKTLQTVNILFIIPFLFAVSRSDSPKRSYKANTAILSPKIRNSFPFSSSSLPPSLSHSLSIYPYWYLHTIGYYYYSMDLFTICFVLLLPELKLTITLHYFESLAKQQNITYVVVIKHRSARARTSVGKQSHL